MKRLERMSDLVQVYGMERTETPMRLNATTETAQADAIVNQPKRDRKVLSRRAMEAMLDKAQKQKTAKALSADRLKQMIDCVENTELVRLESKNKN